MLFPSKAVVRAPPQGSGTLQLWKLLRKVEENP